MPVYEIKSARGGISDYEDKGIPGAFKKASNVDIRKVVDSISCQQALVDEGITLQSASPSVSPSASRSPSASVSPSPSASPSTSPSPSLGSPSSSVSPSASRSPSASSSPSASVSASSSVSPSVSVSAELDSVFHDLIRAFINSADGNTYGFGSKGYVYKRTPGGAWSQVYKAKSAIKGAWEFPANNGKTYMHFALNTELHRKEMITGSASWNDVNAGGGWPKTNLSPADWHTMRESGGALTICNSNKLALVGYDQSYTNNALDLIPGNIARTLVERNGRTIVGTVRSSDPNRGVNAMVDTEVPLAQAGTNGDIFYANMSDTIPLKRFPGGGKVNPYGVSKEIDQAYFFDWDHLALNYNDKKELGNLALWAVYGATAGDNGIYTLGRKYKNHPFTLNLDYKLEADELGAIVITDDGTLLVSYQIGTEYGVKKVDPNTKAVGTYGGLDFRSPVKEVGKETVWGLVEVFMKPLPAGCSVEMFYKRNKYGSFVRAKTADNQNAYTTTNGSKAIFSIADEAEIIEPEFVLTPSGNETPEIHRARMYFA